MQPLLEPPHCLHLKKCSSHAPELLRDLMQHKGNGDNRGRDNSGISVKTKWFHQAQLLRLSRPLDTHCRGRARLYPNPKDFETQRHTGPPPWQPLAPCTSLWCRTWRTGEPVPNSVPLEEMGISSEQMWLQVRTGPKSLSLNAHGLQTTDVKQNGQCRMGWGSSSSLRAKQNHPG